MTPSLPIVRLKSVVEYAETGDGNEKLLDHVSLDIPPATSVGILGAAKSGKSTLARLIAGQMKPYRGTVEINGNICWAAEAPIKPMAALSLRDYVHFIARMYSADPDHVFHNVSYIGGFPEGQPLLIGDLSKIDRGKLNFALKFALDFDCYILDEQTLTTEPIFKLLAETIIERMRRRRSIVMLGKSERILRRFCDVIYKLDGGKLHELNLSAPVTETAQNDPE